MPGDVPGRGRLVAANDPGHGVQGAAHGAAGAGAEPGQVDGRRVFVDPGDAGDGEIGFGGSGWMSAHALTIIPF